jgi:hypothetical protein
MPDRFDQIDQVTLSVKEWAGNVALDASISFGPPASQSTGQGVSIYLLDIASRPPMRGIARAPLQIQLRYLVSTWAGDPLEAQRLLGDLVFAAMQNADYEVALEPLPPATWHAFGVRPQPSFLLCLPLCRQRPEPETRLVLKPLVIQAAPVVSLDGLVLGVLDSEEAPLAGARVELPALQLYGSTDAEGRFSFPTVPGGDIPKELVVKARGRVLAVTLDRPTSSRDPLVIRLDLSG